MDDLHRYAPLRAHALHKAHRGRSLIEVLLTVTIAGILAATGAPNFQHWLASNRMVTQTNNLVRDLHFGRTMAITRNVAVVICESSDHTSCSFQRDWSRGWIVFADGNANRQRDKGEKILAVNTGFRGTVVLRAQGRYGYRNVVFSPDGRAKNGTFTLCDHHGNARAVVLHMSGRPRVAYTRAGGDPLRCPSG